MRDLGSGSRNSPIAGASTNRPKKINAPGTLSVMQEQTLPKVTIAGALSGDYVVIERHTDDSLLVAPATSLAATLAQHQLRPVTTAEFEAAAGAQMLPSDDEG